MKAIEYTIIVSLLGSLRKFRIELVPMTYPVEQKPGFINHVRHNHHTRRRDKNKKPMNTEAKYKYYKSKKGDRFIKVFNNTSVEVYLSEYETSVEFEGKFGDMWSDDSKYTESTDAEFINAYRKHQENILDFILEVKPVNY